MEDENLGQGKQWNINSLSSKMCSQINIALSLLAKTVPRIQNKILLL